jgi:ACS family sodium-dependent inorganic phosphate cotransporter
MSESSGRFLNWPRRYTIVALCVFAVFICYADRVNISVAAIAMQEEFGWSETTKGYVLSSFFIGYLLFQIPSGWLANKLGGKLILGFAVLWWSLFTFLTPFAAGISIIILIVTRIGMGLGEAAMFPSAYNLYSRWVPPSERSRSVSLLIGGIPLGTLFALLITGWLVETHGWPVAFYSFGAGGAVWVVIWYFYAHDDPATDPRCSEDERKLLLPLAKPTDQAQSIPWKEFAKSKAIWALIINHFCSNWILYMLLAWLPSYFRSQHDLSIMNAGLYSAAPYLSMLIVGNLGGIFADQLHARGMSLTRVRKIMQVSGLLGSAACLLAVKDVSDPYLAMAFMSGALGLAALMWSGFVSNHLDIAPRYADVLMGITNTAGTIPGIIGVIITGWLVDTTGTFASAFTLCAAINVFGAIVWVLFSTAEKIID